MTSAYTNIERPPLPRNDQYWIVRLTSLNCLSAHTTA